MLFNMIFTYNIVGKLIRVLSKNVCKYLASELSKTTFRKVFKKVPHDKIILEPYPVIIFKRYMPRLLSYIVITGEGCANHVLSVLGFRVFI